MLALMMIRLAFSRIPLVVKRASPILATTEQVSIIDAMNSTILTSMLIAGIIVVGPRVQRVDGRG